MTLRFNHVRLRKGNKSDSFLKNFIYSGLYLIFLQLACHSDSDSNSNKLLYWSSNNQDEIEFASDIVQGWNQSHPRARVKFQPVPEGRSSEEIILAAVVGETTPDIYSNMWQGDVEFYAQSGVLVPLDTIPGFIEFMFQR